MCAFIIVSLVLSFLSLVYWWWWWSWCMASSHIPVTLRWICRGLSRLEHSFSCGYTHVGGRGCVHCVCNFGPMLQVSRSTQKLLALPQVSEQTVQVEIHILSICSLLSLRSFVVYFVVSFCFVLLYYLLFGWNNDKTEHDNNNRKQIR